MKKRLIGFYYSFPIQLVILHFKKNTLLLSLWVVLILFFSGNIGRKLGVNYLFLDPEYLGEVGFWSFFFMGLTFCAFLMAWNISTYLLHSTRFPFLASLKRPFFKFMINNFIIPLLFLLIYFGHVLNFQTYNQLTANDMLGLVAGFLLGLLSSFLMIIVYFRLINRDIYSYDITMRYQSHPLLRGFVNQRNKAQEKATVEKNKWPVKYYMTEKLRMRFVRSVAHYNQNLLRAVFNQHHKNATILQLFSILVLISLGYLIDYEIFRIPAGASIFILFAVITSALGALWYWLRGWHVLAILSICLGLNYLSGLSSSKYLNKGYGLDYSTRTSYQYDSLEQLFNKTTVERDKNTTIQLLNNWRSKFNTTTRKPKMVMIGVSGGGLRAAVWTTRVLQYADSLLQGQLLSHATLITGASGGMLGAGYMRELYLQQQLGNTVNLYDSKYLDNMAKDLLNPIAFTIAVNDIIMPLSFFKLDNQRYPKDRGYVFEKQAIENTDSAFDRRLSYYTTYEQQGIIPMMFITPVIINDARRLIISSQKVSYMTQPKVALSSTEIDGIDFGQLFQSQNAYNLRFISALRMNATYPYILPNVYLPSEPAIEVMDAGWRDNYGFDTPARFIHVFKDWIKANTSGVVLVQIRGVEKVDSITSNRRGIISRLLNPIELTINFFELQDYNQDASLGYLQDILGEDNIEVVRFIYHPNILSQPASMSFHLTKREKKDIIHAVKVPANRESMRQLRQLLK